MEKSNYAAVGAGSSALGANSDTRRRRSAAQKLVRLREAFDVTLTFLDTVISQGITWLDIVEPMCTCCDNLDQGRQMELEVEVSELLDMLRAAADLGLADPLNDVVLYNPATDTESRPQTFEGGIFVLKSADGSTRRVPAAAISTWSALISSQSVLNTGAILSSTRNAQRVKCVSQMNSLSLPTGNSQSNEDFEAILTAWRTPITKTKFEFRHALYSAIKKLENEAGRASDSYRLGLLLMERWNQLPLEDCPPDFLIQLAYYRRWNRRTDEALVVSEILERRDVDRILNSKEKAILATERAAAFMDRYERTGSGLDQTLRYLRYHHKLRAGHSDEHNLNAWKRYEKLLADRSK